MVDVKNPPNLIGRSRAIQNVLRLVAKVAPTDSTVLILGESGTGKELVARHIHSISSRSEMPVVSVNCSAFNDTLLESELFGYRKGAFTGANQNKTGLFQMAHGGTLFLDEVAEMSADMQKKLLRVLEDGEVRPLGSEESYQADVRIIAATNKDLKKLAERGKFREDLYFRLDVLTIPIPPLRERKEDIPDLLDYYSQKICDELKRPVIEIPEGIRSMFIEYSWPGNVRELVNELRRVIILESQYSFSQFNARQPATRAPQQADVMPLSSMEKQSILGALQKVGGNKSKAAQLLGIARRTLYQKMKRFKIT